MKKPIQKSSKEKYVIIENGYLYISPDKSSYETGKHQIAMRLERVKISLIDLNKSKKSVYHIRVKARGSSVLLCYLTWECRDSWFAELLRHHCIYYINRKKSGPLLEGTLKGIEIMTSLNILNESSPENVRQKDSKQKKPSKFSSVKKAYVMNNVIEDSKMKSEKNISKDDLEKTNSLVLDKKDKLNKEIDLINHELVKEEIPEQFLLGKKSNDIISSDSSSINHAKQTMRKKKSSLSSLTCKYLRKKSFVGDKYTTPLKRKRSANASLVKRKRNRSSSKLLSSSYKPSEFVNIETVL